VRSLLLLIVAMALSAEAPAPALLQEYEQALAAHHLERTSAVVDELIRQRVPIDGKPRPDPLLNAMIGRLYLIANREADASNYLDQAPIAELPISMRAPTALDHGRALELRGDRAAALVAYREALGVSQNDEQRRRAQIGIARQLIALDPAAVRNQLLPVANGPVEPQRWEARYLLAMANSILGDAASARQWAEGAWADSATAPVNDLAPLRVETLQAGLAAAAHDPATERAMLTSANGLSVSPSAWLSAQLPVCGDSDVRPSDFVIFGFVVGPYKTRALFPVAASRPEVVRPFADNLGGTVPIEQGASATPMGTVFTVRCRTVVSDHFIGKPVAGDPLIKWSIERGIYPASVSYVSDDQHLRAIDERIAALSARFGTDSPLLIMPRWQAMTILEARSISGDQVVPTQIADLGAKVASSLKAAGAPQWFASAMQLRAQFDQLSRQAEASAQPTAQMESLSRKEVLEVPFDIARQAVVGMVAELHGDWPSPISQFVLDLNSKAPSSLTGRTRQAWELTVANALRSSDRDAQARAVIKDAELPMDICVAADSELSLQEQHFSYGDYPEELVAGGQEGVVFFEFNLSKAGKVTDPRVIYSLPSNLFDDASAKGISSIRYSAPTREGTLAGCRGIYQPIRWQLDDADTFAIPRMLPQMPDRN
jgi:TonB family protein